MRRVKDGIVAVVGLCLGRGRGTEFVQSNCEDNVKEPQYILVSMSRRGRADELNAKRVLHAIVATMIDPSQQAALAPRTLMTLNSCARLRSRSEEERIRIRPRGNNIAGFRTKTFSISTKA